MIPQIKEINFPTDTTLSTATASLVEMGDKTISAQVKIDGSIKPDFSYDWEIEFQGERYIQPLREPQASKGNESINSIIDLTFYHKGIYDLKRYFFVSIVELEAGTIMADNYIVPLKLNIGEFVDYLNKVLSYYYGSTYTIQLNPDYPFDETDKKNIDINNTKIWDVVTQIYKWFGVRWSWETHQKEETREYTYCIKVGYDPVETSHIFEYGFKGGLLKFEHQVQNAEIANVVFGRGSSENIPYRYFKNADPNNDTFPADPDWIPELANVHFANLRGKTFRDYVKGWKTNPNRDTLNGTLLIEERDLAKYYTNEAYRKGHDDTTFNPIEYVKDYESIDKYGEIQKGLEHNEEIKPTIQGVDILGIGRVDQVVDVEPILVDESTEDTEVESKVMDVQIEESFPFDETPSSYTASITKDFVVPSGYKGNFIKDWSLEIIQNVGCTDRQYSSTTGITTGTYKKSVSHPLDFEVENLEILNKDGKPLDDLVEIDGGTTIRIWIKVKFSNFFKQVYYFGDELYKHGYLPQSGDALERTPNSYFSVKMNFSWQLDYTPIHGQILGNYESGATRKSQSIEVSSEGTKQVKFETKEFIINEDDAPATNVDVPYRVIPLQDGVQYIAKPNVYAINTETNEQVSPINLPSGKYKLVNEILITNLSDNKQEFKVELLPTYIYYSYESKSWKPKFDIWIKNIWQTMPEKGESDSKYEHRIWDAILGNHLGEDAKVVFSSGMLSGHSDWEFLIADTPKRDTSKTIDYVPSEWRITLYKSDAELDATGKYIPSTMTQASAGDHFYFTGIELPQQYVEWAEERLDEYKREELAKYSEIKPTIIIHTDPVRINELQGEETSKLIDSLKVGNLIKVKDFRFIKSDFETLRLQSITYTWNDSTILYPNVEIVLSNDVVILRPKIEEVTSNIIRISRDVSNLRSSSTKELKATKSSFNSRIDKSNNAIVLLERRVLNLEKISGGTNFSELEKKVQTNSESIDAILTVKTINKRNEITILTKLKK